MQGNDPEFCFFSELGDADLRPPGVLAELRAEADVQIHGSRPWDIQILDKQLFNAVLTRGSLGFGESYMEGHWECYDLSGLMTRLLSARLDEKSYNFV